MGEREGTSSDRTNTSKGIETHKKQKNSRNTILRSSYGDLVLGPSCRVGAKLQATNRVPRPVDRGTATRYGG